MENQTITLNDKEYSVEGLSDLAKYFLNHISSVEQKIQNNAFERDQLVAAKTHFVNALSIEVEKENNEAEKEAE